MTGCQGELANEKFAVHIEDMDNNVVMDKTLQSQPNGFIDLWLPRDKKYRLKIEQSGKMTESEISTYENSDTCITTMQLK